MIRFTEQLTNIQSAAYHPKIFISTPPDHMLAFHLVNKLKFHYDKFLTIVTDLKSDNVNTINWYQAGNMGQTLYTSISHAEVCRNILSKTSPTLHILGKEAHPKIPKTGKTLKTTKSNSTI